MRALIKFENRGEVSLPIHYNHYVEAAIYNSLSPQLSDFLHKYGFEAGKRKFKLFTFSRILGKYKVSGGRIRFSGDISLLVSSPIEGFIVDLVNGIMKRRELRIGRTVLSVRSIYFPKPPEFKRKVLARTLSPITVYSTLLAGDGSKKTYYYSPFEKQFSELISANALKKASLLHKVSVKTGLILKPLKMKEVFLSYKGTVIRGWVGRFELSGPITLIRITYDAGLGSKNSEGFGMYEIISERAVKGGG